MNPHLFVYGSLMSSRTDAFGQAMRRRLQREATRLGPATICGRLYDLGRYPGVVDGDAEDDVVYGEIHLLERPYPTLRWLDAYEGISPGRNRPDDEYARVDRPVTLADPAGPRILKAWVYLYRLDITGKPRVAGGRW